MSPLEIEMYWSRRGLYVAAGEHPDSADRSAALDIAAMRDDFRELQVHLEHQRDYENRMREAICEILLTAEDLLGTHIAHDLTAGERAHLRRIIDHTGELYAAANRFSERAGRYEVRLNRIVDAIVNDAKHYEENAS